MEKSIDILHIAFDYREIMKNNSEEIVEKLRVMVEEKHNLKNLIFKICQKNNE